MTKEEFMVVLEQTFERLKTLTLSKGIEYANSTDQLDNFHRQARELDVPKEVVLMVYLNKHIDAIKHYARVGRVLSEPIDGRIYDAILYLILLLAMAEDDRKNNG